MTSAHKQHRVRTSSDYIKTKAARLNQLLAQRGIRQQDLARSVGMSHQTISKLCRGQQDLSYDWAQRLAPILNVSPSLLLADDGELVVTQNNNIVKNIPISIKIASDVRNGKINFKRNSSSIFFETNWISNHLKSEIEDLIFVEIEGHSMEPLLREGDLVLVNTSKKHVFEPGLFVITDGKAFICRWLEKLPGRSPAMLSIKTENPKFSDATEYANQVSVIGRVVWRSHKS